MKQFSDHELDRQLDHVLNKNWDEGDGVVTGYDGLQYTGSRLPDAEVSSGSSSHIDDLNRALVAGDLQAYLVAMVRGQPVNQTGKHRSVEEFVAANGRGFAPQRDRVPLMRAKRCFANAFSLALRRGLIYVEGYAMVARRFPWLHAWCVRADGLVLEPTWGDGFAYFGVPLDLGYVARFRRRRREIGSVIDDYPGFPLIREDRL